MKLVFLLLVSATNAAEQGANPIRKVVTMLQLMQQKVEAEGYKEKELFEKFQCYCKNGAGDLEKSIAASKAKASEGTSDLEEAQQSLAQHEAALKDHHADRAASEAAMKKATAIREKEAAEFAKVKGDDDTNLVAMDKAIAALEKGVGAAFLQTPIAQTLRTIAAVQTSMTDFDRNTLLSFLSGARPDYAPQSGEIIGILKQMRETMASDLADATATEKASIKSYEELMAANKKIIQASTDAIEAKTQRVGELKVEIVNLKDAIADAAASGKEDAAFLANLAKDCKTKVKEYEERVKLRNEELLAIADTIKVLNDDDALELFKKRLPSAASSFMQIAVTAEAMRERAQSLISNMRHTCTNNCVQLDLISLALHGKKVSFAKVIGMIDEMVVLLGHEQTDDDDKKEYCEVQFDKLDDEKKALERSISDLETAIAQTKDAIATLADEIEALTAGIKKLDKQVAEATAQRKEEHDEFTTLMAENTAVKELLKFAINRLNKFYNPKLYVAPAKRELDREGRVLENLGGDIPVKPAGGIAGTGITVALDQDAPAPPPETWGAYKKSGQSATGVIEMINLLVADVDKDMTEAQTEEKNDQAAYEELMADSAKKRTQDSKSLADKVDAKTEAEAALLAKTEEKSTTEKQLMATEKVIAALHGECDWLLQNFEARKAARAGEVDSLKNAKAILSGADYSLLQTNERSFLRKKM